MATFGRTSLRLIEIIDPFLPKDLGFRRPTSGFHEQASGSSINCWSSFSPGGVPKRMPPLSPRGAKSSPLHEDAPVDLDAELEFEMTSPGSFSTGFLTAPRRRCTPGVARGWFGHPVIKVSREHRGATRRQTTEGLPTSRVQAVPIIQG